MAGVSGPLFAGGARRGIRFLVSYSAGYVMAALVLGIVLTALQAGLSDSLTSEARVTAAIGIVLLLGVLDLVDRTPTVRRQTPKAWIDRAARQADRGSRELTAFAWGVDIGLIGTTVKITSLIWAGLALAVLLQPVDPLAVLLSYAAAALAAHWTTTFLISRRSNPVEFAVRLTDVSLPFLRRSSGLLLILLAVALVPGGVW